MKFWKTPRRFLSGGVFCLLIVALGAGEGCGERASDARRPGIMRGCIARISGFDPVRVGDVASVLAIARVYEGLLQYAYLARPYRLEPLLAENLPAVSPDGLTYTFAIRRGIFFQDDPCFQDRAGRGRELTAEDFIYSLKRVADPTNASSGWWAFNDRIAGLNEFRAAALNRGMTDYEQPVAGLRAPDPYTLEIRLTRPYPQLLWVLAMHYAAAVPREAVEFYGADFVNHPVGTGPFILKSWIHNYRMEFVRNPKWAETGRREPLHDHTEWAVVNGGAPAVIPSLDAVILYVMDDAATRWLAFLRGQVDLYTDVSRDEWDAIMTPAGDLDPEFAAQGIRMASIQSLNTYYIAFNMDDPVLGRNRQLRQALSCAFNTAEWVRFYNGRVARATGPIPPGVAGYDDTPSPYGFDLEKARRLLAAAGYPDGRDPATGRRLELTIELGRTDAETRESTELFISFMDRIGVVVNPSYNNAPAFFKKIERRQAQMFRLSWVADYPDAENFLQLFYSPNASPGPNRCNYSNPEFDRLYEQARVMNDSPERTALYRRMAAILVEDAPWIFVHHPVDYSLYHTRLKRYVPSDFPYGMDKYWAVE